MKTEVLRPMRTYAVLLAVVAVFGCSRESAPAADKANAPKTEAAPATAGGQPGTAAPGMPPGHPETGAPAAAAGPETVLTGTVVETMDSGGYTYMKLMTTGGEVWSAVNAAKVTAGQTVHVANPMPMDGFESKTLGRKFDRIFFGTLFDPASPQAAPASASSATGGAAAGAMGGPSVPPQVAAQHAAAASGPEVTEKISVAKAEGADGRTIAELYGQRAPLKGKTVAVRGKVVKFNGGIMGKNWVHLRDGSGTPEGKNNDLTVTTDATAKVGDVVVARGTVTTDRDFGAGYTYALLLEDAKLSK